MKQLKTIFFGAVMLLYLWVPFSMIQNQEKIWEEGEVHRFRLVPVDPYDAFRGNYVRLSFGQIQFDKTQDEQSYSRHQEIYLLIAKDSLDYAYFSGFSLEVPSQTNYITSEIQYVTDRQIVVNLPENMQRYYMNEELAPLAEQLYRQQRRRNNQQENTPPIYAEVSTLEGQAQIRNLYFGEEPISTYLRKQIKENQEN